MANVGIGVSNPMYVDAVAAVQVGWMELNSVTWVSDETAGDDIAANDFFELTDTAGTTIICSKTAAFAGDDAHFPMYGLKVNGITCSSIDGGIAFVNVKSYEGVS